MKIKGILLVLLSIFVLQQKVIAANNVPTVCPSVQDVVSAGILQVTKDERENQWIAEQNSHYNTSQEWQFLIVDIFANNANDAKKEADKALPSLSNPRGPKEINAWKIWICEYDLPGYRAIALTPPIQLSVKQIKSL